MAFRISAGKVQKFPLSSLPFGIDLYNQYNQSIIPSFRLSRYPPHEDSCRSSSWNIVFWFYSISCWMKYRKLIILNWVMQKFYKWVEVVSKLLFCSVYMWYIKESALLYFTEASRDNSYTYFDTWSSVCPHKL